MPRWGSGRTEVRVSTYADQHRDPPTIGAGLSIKGAADLLGVPAPTLRSWERRYGLPTTGRSVGGHRRYRPAELIQLSLMRDEIAIGRQAADAARRVRGMLDESNPGVARVHALLAASHRRDSPAIRVVLETANDELGLAATLDDLVMPAMRQIGAWWETGDCEVDQEHFTTAVVRSWLAKVATLAPAPAAGSRTVVLATGPADSHTLGLEALAALLAEQGLASRLLGPRTSTAALVAAATTADDALVVVVSHLPTQRRAAIASLDAAAALGVPTLYAGNAFLFPASRKNVPGAYLGESLGEAALVISRFDGSPETFVP